MDEQTLKKKPRKYLKAKTITGSLIVKILLKSFFHPFIMTTSKRKSDVFETVSSYFLV